MSILINGMEMPRKCIRCPVNVYGRCLVNDDKDVSKATADAVRDKDCPLIPIPPHGRLGDLDKLENGLRHMAKYQHGERQQGILGCCETIRTAPTIIEASGKDVDATVKEET